jgi:hypothetical protein
MSGLTGRFNFRKTLRGRLGLVVEEEYRSLWGGEKRRWRSATLADLAEPEMRALVDLRFQRQFGGLSSRGRAKLHGGEDGSNVMPIPKTA